MVCVPYDIGQDNFSSGWAFPSSGISVTGLRDGNVEKKEENMCTLYKKVETLLVCKDKQKNNGISRRIKLPDDLNFQCTWQNECARGNDVFWKSVPSSGPYIGITKLRTVNKAFQHFKDN